VRSHEGPDAREQRPPEERMDDMKQGYAVDHHTPSEPLPRRCSTCLPCAGCAPGCAMGGALCDASQ
jgi:hypothetical protein